MPEIKAVDGMPKFQLECRAHFTASRSRDFQKLLEDVREAAERLSTADEILYATAELADGHPDKTFTIILRISNSSWFDGETQLDGLVVKVLADAKIPEHGVNDSAFERYMKSQNDRLVLSAGRTVAEFTTIA